MRRILDIIKYLWIHEDKVLTVVFVVAFIIALSAWGFQKQKNGDLESLITHYQTTMKACSEVSRACADDNLALYVENQYLKARIDSLEAR